ncbi:MAG: DUF1192 domain-containing protein [Hyphomicrobiales bacterium]|nr:DUF1192 domain-containing protein [Hyphomicrobiales bacterium]
MNDDVINKKSIINTLITESLDELSITELRERISFLKDEINRCKEKIDNKKLSKSAADKIFK